MLQSILQKRQSKASHLLTVTDEWKNRQITAAEPVNHQQAFARSDQKVPVAGAPTIDQSLHSSL